MRSNYDITARPLAGRLALWWRRRRERNELSALSDRDLADIGVRWHDAAREAAKPFWRA